MKTNWSPDAKKGDQDALKEIYDEYHDKVYRHCLRGGPAQGGIS